jgi:hypothetical protein
MAGGTWFDENAPRTRGTSDPVSGSPGQDITSWPTPPTLADIGTGTIASPAPAVNAQDPQAYFQSLIAGKPGTPQTLISLEPQLAQQGIKVLRNAAGVAGKIQLPNGQVVDVIRGAGAGGGADNWQWLTGESGGGSAGAGSYGLPPGYQMGTFTGGGQYPLASVMAPGLMQPWTTPFSAPNDVTQQNDPGWQFRMKEGLKAVERSAAAKGTLLSGGTLKDMNRWAQDYASNEYDKIYNRSLGEYQQAYSIYNNNAANQFGRLFNVMGAGQNAAAQTGQFGTSYGANAGNALMNAGNSLASGQQGSANAWAGGINNAGNVAGQYYWLNQIMNPPGGQNAWLANASSYPPPFAGDVGGSDYPNWTRTVPQ